jgi:hypothetical protein
MDLWAYAIMPEHVHLIVSPRRCGKDVAKFQSAVKEKVGWDVPPWRRCSAPNYDGATRPFPCVDPSWTGPL